MTESFAEYRRRVLGYLGPRDPMRVLAATPRQLAGLIEGHRRPALARRPAPGTWSTVEIVAHLADAELAFGWRIRSMVASPGVSLAWWDQHIWSEKCVYARIPVRQSLATFSALRSSNLALLRRVPRALHTAAYGVHDTRGRQSVREFVVLEAAHDLNHLSQIRGLLER
jgi:DinB superfamily